MAWSEAARAAAAEARRRRKTGQMKPKTLAGATGRKNRNTGAWETGKLKGLGSKVPNLHVKQVGEHRLAHLGPLSKAVYRKLMRG